LSALPAPLVFEDQHLSAGRHPGNACGYDGIVVTHSRLRSNAIAIGLCSENLLRGEEIDLVTIRELEQLARSGVLGGRSLAADDAWD
jgi:hypothetical protein